MQETLDQISATLTQLAPDFADTTKMLMALDLSQTARQRFVRMAGHNIIDQAHAAVFWDRNAWTALRLRQLARDLQAQAASPAPAQAGQPQSTP